MRDSNTTLFSASFGEEQAFAILVQYLFGDASKEEVISQYKWSDNDTLEDVIKHIEWSHDKRVHQKDHLSGPTKEAQDDEYQISKIGKCRKGNNPDVDNLCALINKSLKRPSSREMAHPPTDRERCMKYMIIDSSEYMLNGKLYEIGSFGTLGSSIIDAWAKESNSPFTRSPCPSPLDISGRPGPSILSRNKSLFLKIEIIRDHMVRELGRETFLHIYTQLKQLVNGMKKIPTHKIQDILGGFLYNLLERRSFTLLIVHLIINEHVARSA